MQERVFECLGMSRTSMVWQDRFESDYANGYDEYGRSLGPQKREKADAAGPMQKNIADFAGVKQAVEENKLVRGKKGGQKVNPQISNNLKNQLPTFPRE